MNADLITVESVQEKVYERLKGLLTSSQLAPGERVSIRQLAEAFGVSTMPVREALRKLEAEGMVVYERRGVTIRQLSAKEVEEIFEIRNRLETLAITWALPNLTDDAVCLLTQVVDDMDMLLATDRANVDVDAWRTLNAKFHLGLYKLAGSQQLQQMIENLWVSVEAYMRLYTATVSSFEQAQREHHEMLDLIKAKQAESLCHLVAVHLDNTQKIILENFH